MVLFSGKVQLSLKSYLIAFLVLAGCSQGGEEKIQFQLDDSVLIVDSSPEYSLEEELSGDVAKYYKCTWEKAIDTANVDEPKGISVVPWKLDGWNIRSTEANAELPKCESQASDVEKDLKIEVVTAYECPENSTEERCSDLANTGEPEQLASPIIPIYWESYIVTNPWIKKSADQNEAVSAENGGLVYSDDGDSLGNVDELNFNRSAYKMDFPSSPETDSFYVVEGYENVHSIHSSLAPNITTYEYFKSLSAEQAINIFDDFKISEPSASSLAAFADYDDCLAAEGVNSCWSAGQAVVRKDESATADEIWVYLNVQTSSMDAVNKHLSIKLGKDLGAETLKYQESETNQLSCPKKSLCVLWAVKEGGNGSEMEITSHLLFKSPVASEVGGTVIEPFEIVDLNDNELVSNSSLVVLNAVENSM